MHAQPLCPNTSASQQDEQPHDLGGDDWLYGDVRCVSKGDKRDDVRSLFSQRKIEPEDLFVEVTWPRDE